MVDVPDLLNDVCARLGYCLPPDEQQRLVAEPPKTIDAFIDAIIVAEGRDPAVIDTEQRRQVRRVVAKWFGEPLPPARSDVLDQAGSPKLTDTGTSWLVKFGGHCRLVSQR